MVTEIDFNKVASIAEKYGVTPKIAFDIFQEMRKIAQVHYFERILVNNDGTFLIVEKGAKIPDEVVCLDVHEIFSRINAKKKDSPR